MISEILPEDKRRLHELEEQVTQLESSKSGTTRGGGTNIYDVQMGLDDMSNRLVELEALVNKEPKARRDDYRRRVTHLKSSFDHVKKSFDAVARRQGVNLSLQGQRAELFAGGADRDANYNNPNFDLEAAEAGSLTSSSRMVGDYLAVGQETLAELHAQRDRLKGVQKKVFDMLNYLGMYKPVYTSVCVCICLCFLAHSPYP